MKEPLFEVVEYHSFFAVRHKPSGMERPMGDGVDALFDSDGEAVSPGSPGFCEDWAAMLNEMPSDVLAAYFPDLVE
jgi:hypothetical protein